MNIIRLHDGTPLTADHFTIRDELRRIRSGEKRGIALAWNICANTSHYSLVVVRSESIVARALGQESVKQAFESVELQLVGSFRRDQRFVRRMVAVLNFVPSWVEAEMMARTGVDALFIPEPLAAGIGGANETLMRMWLGIPREQFGEKSWNGLQKRAIMYPEKRLKK